MKVKCTKCDKEFENSEVEKHFKDSHGEIEEKGVSVSVEKIVAKAVEKLADVIAQQKGLSDADKSDLKTKILAPEITGGNSALGYPSDLGNLSKDAKIVLFIKSLVGRARDPYTSEHDRVFKALVEGTDAEGGYLVPEEFRSEVFRIMTDTAVMRKIATVIPMNTDTLNLNTLVARPSAYWTPEYGAKTTSSAEFGRLVLSPNDLVCLLPVTHQLLNDANINLVQFITQLFAEAIALAEDKAFFTGSGTGQPKGINQESITSLAGNISMDGVISLIDSVAGAVARDPSTAFVGNRYVKRQLRLLKDSTGNYLWRNGGSASGNAGEVGRLPDELYGYPFYEQNDLENSLYFGAWRNYVIGDRQQMVVSTTTEGGDAWRRNSMEIKAVERVDGKTVLPSAFAKLTNV